VAGGLNLYQFNGNNPVSNTDPFGLSLWFIPVVVGGVAVANSPAGQRLAQQAAVGLGLAAAAVVVTSDQVAEVGAQVVESVGSTLRKIGNAIATAVGIGTGDKVPQIDPEPPPPTGKSAPPPPGTGKSPIEIGKDGIPRIKIPVDP
jgi:hypothetical protein